jgi:predicted dehydrogenase
MSEKSRKLSRRNFLETTTLGAAGVMVGSSAGPALGAIKGANDRIQIGVIGPGERGSGLVRSLATLANAKITAVCDIFEPNLKRGANLAASQPKEFTDYRRVIESKDVNAVVIATPLHLHSEMTIAALNAGKHVFVEKTMAYSVEQCNQMVKAAKAHPSLVVQVGFQRHHYPVVRKAVEMARAGAFGKVTHIRCTWHRNGNWRRAVPQVNADLRQWGYPDLEHLINWRMYKKYSQGLMAELGSHMLEVVNLIYNSMPAAVTGFGGIDYWKDGRETFDNVNVIYTYPAGQKAMFTSITTNAQYGERIQIMGTEGTFDMTWNQGLYYREKQAGGAVRTEGATVVTATGETMKSEGQSPGTQVTGGTQGRVDPTKLILQSFLDCVREGKKPEVDVHTGRESAISILLANQAMEEGRVVKF